MQYFSLSYNFFIFPSVFSVIWYNGTMKDRNHLSIQKRILVITLTCILSMCILVICVSYYLFHTYLQRSLVQSTETNLQLLSDSIDNSLGDINRMVRFCQTNSEIATYIERNPNPGSVLSVRTFERISEEYSNNPSNNYIIRLAVITEDHFLQQVSASYSSTANLAKEVPKMTFFDTLLQADGYNLSPGLITDPFYRKGRQVFPVIRPITYQFNAVQGGYLFMEVSSSLFTDPLNRYAIAEDSSIFLTMGERNYIYEDGALTEWEGSYTLLEELSASSMTGLNRIFQIRNAEGRKITVVTSPLYLPGCYISQSISSTELFNQQALFWALIGITLVSMIAIGILLMVLMNHMINVPVSKLQDRMRRISNGDFGRDASIEWNHELGDIGRGINDLSENVNVLMNRRLEDEKQKRDLEYKMLQSQINPHFIYNTLNSIKWMASVQGADGISEMTTALARLLKSISKGTSLLIPIREELELIKDYFTIQSYRYGGTITLDIQIDGEELLDDTILKFTLQPLVENSIFHGIEPKGSTGRIVIHAYPEDRDNLAGICIDVTDDGVGMSPEKTKQVLQNHDDRSADFFREIGVSNVHRRLQYEFGEQYGITITSAEGEYTTMSIHLPNRKSKLI